jgi:hypothetical protein
MAEAPAGIIQEKVNRNARSPVKLRRLEAPAAVLALGSYDSRTILEKL